MTEKEIKYLVDKDEFQKMLALAATMYPDVARKEISQINYYYDTSDFFLSQNNMTLRVRKINNKYCMQLKTNKSIENGVRIAEEKERILDSLPDFFSGESAGFETDKTFHRLGKLKTNRIRFKLSDGTNIDFDISNYFDKTDYEIEIELGENPPTGFITKMSHNPINFCGKFERFIQRKINININIT